MNTAPRSKLRRVRAKSLRIEIGAVLQYLPRRSKSARAAVVKVVAESRTGWFVVERIVASGDTVRRHVKGTHLQERQPELF